MGIEQPTGDNKLNNPDHAKLHRVVGIDESADDKTITVDENNITKIGDADGSNYSKIEADGTIEFNGNATVWDDLRVPVTTAKPGNVVPDFAGFLATGGLKTYLFDGGGRAEEIHFIVQMPHSYKLGTNITPHVHWTPTDTNTGNVRWSLEYTWQQRGAVFGASTTIHIIDAASGTAWDHLLRANFAAIDGSGISLVSSMLVCRLFRNSADGGDTYASDAALLEIDFHYEIDTVGSRGMVAK